MVIYKLQPRFPRGRWTGGGMHPEAHEDVKPVSNGVPVVGLIFTSLLIEIKLTN